MNETSPRNTINFTQDMRQKNSARHAGNPSISSRPEVMLTESSQMQSEAKLSLAAANPQTFRGDEQEMEDVEEIDENDESLNFRGAKTPKANEDKAKPQEESGISNVMRQFGSYFQKQIQQMGVADEREHIETSISQPQLPEPVEEIQSRQMPKSSARPSVLLTQHSSPDPFDFG